MKRICSLLLAAAALLMLAPGALAGEEVPAEAQASAAGDASSEICEDTQALPEETPAEETPAEEAPAGQPAVYSGSGTGPARSCTEALPEDSAVLLGDYLNLALGDTLFVTDGPAADSGTLAGDRLSACDRALYDQLKAAVEAIAAGLTESTVITLTIPEIDTGKTYTAEDLGLSGDVMYYNDAEELVPAQGTVDALYGTLTFDLPLVIAALLHDCPYDLYWYGNYSTWTLPGYTYTSSDPASVEIGFSENTIALSVRVQNAYRAGSDYTIGTGAASSTVTAVNTAQAVVDAAAGMSDYRKLAYYKNWICASVSYDHAAAGSADLQPWNVIYVFDGDSSTNVVCEGYARAFQYLCDLTDWTGDVSCLTVSGYMNGSTHAWNVVRMPDGQNYLTDVTNCDAGTVGYPDGLFLVGGSGSASGGYTFCGNRYVCDSVTAAGRTSMWDLYTDDMLTLAGSSYAASAEETAGIGTESFLTGWVYEGGNYYYYENGVPLLGRWLRWGRTWYYLKADGVMAADETLQIYGSSYVFRADGAMVTGWVYLSDGWHYCDASGAMRTGWLRYGGTWYYLQPGKNGVMAADEMLEIGGASYAFRSGGAMVTGWKYIGGSYYYFLSSGAKYTASSELAYDGWLKVGSHWYYFGTDGAMFADCTAAIAGVTYRFDSNGGYTVAG